MLSHWSRSCKRSNKSPRQNSASTPCRCALTPHESSTPFQRCTVRISPRWARPPWWISWQALAWDWKMPTQFNLPSMRAAITWAYRTRRTSNRSKSTRSSSEPRPWDHITAAKRQAQSSCSSNKERLRFKPTMFSSTSARSKVQCTGHRSEMPFRSKC